MGRPAVARTAPQEANLRTTAHPAVPDGGLLRAAMGSFPTGVALLGCGSGADSQLMTANSVLSVSLDPMLILVSVRETARIRTAIEQSGGYAVSILSREQRRLSDLFARHDRPTGLEAAALVGAKGGGHAMVAGALAAIECSVLRVDPAGDHVLFLGEVQAIRLGTPNAAPLVFHRGGYPRLDAG